MIIDTHCHAGKNWFEPIEVLIKQMELNNVDGSVLIQHNGVYNNNYLLEISKNYPKKFKVCVNLSPEDKNPLENLQNYKDQGASGLRISSNNSYKNVSINDLIKYSGKLNLIISYQGSLDFFASTNFKSLVSQNENTKIVIEHLAGIGYEYPDKIDEFNIAIESLSLKNVFMKIPGQGEYTKRPKILNENFDLGPVPPLVDIVYKKYGSEKMMWGSDFPPCAGREGYMNTLNSIKNNKIFTSKKHIQNVIGNTAAKIWGFK